MDYLDQMDKAYKRELSYKGISRSEQLKKQISDYELFVKYLDIYIVDIQCRIKRLRDFYNKELLKEKNK